MSNRNKSKIVSVVPETSPELRLKSALEKNRAKLGEPPDQFDEGLKEIWNRLADLAAHSIKLEPGYRLIFELFCDSYRAYREIDEQLRDEGYFYHTSSSHMDRMARKHPLFEMRSTAQKRLIGFAEEFGFSPIAREKLKSFIMTEADPSDEFFN